MSEENLQSKNKPLRPLQTVKYFRSEEVIAQIQWLSSLSTSEIGKLAHERVDASSYVVKEETLVYLLREAHKSDNLELADELSESLLKRIAPSVRRATIFIKTSSETHWEQCVEEITHKVLLSFIDCSAKNEFWELKFWLCLKRVEINVNEKYRRIIENEWNPAIYTDESGSEISTMDQRADPDSSRFQDRLEAKEALGILPFKLLKTAKLLFEEDWSQQEVADYFGVTDKTIRNWLTTIKKTIDAYRKSE